MILLLLNNVEKYLAKLVQNYWDFAQITNRSKLLGVHLHPGSSTTDYARTILIGCGTIFVSLYWLLTITAPSYDALEKYTQRWNRAGLNCKICQATR